MSKDSNVENDWRPALCVGVQTLTELHRTRSGRVTLVGFLAALLLIQTLNFTGFCYREMRYLSDQELINTAVQRLMSEAYLLENDPITYQSAADLYRQNPNCCTLHKWGHNFSYPIVFRVFAYYESIAHIVYRATLRGSDPFLDSYVSMNACGKVFEVTGFPRSSIPVK
jgi:hypothetical protein